MADLQTLLDEFMMAAAEVFAPHPPESALSQADLVSRLETARVNLVKLLDTLPRAHVAVFRERDWVLEHPLECRRDDRALAECPVNSANLDPLCVPAELGRYTVTVRKSRLVVGHPVAPNGHSPRLTDTLRTGSIRQEGADDGGEHSEGRDRQAEPGNGPTGDRAGGTGEDVGQG